MDKEGKTSSALLEIEEPKTRASRVEDLLASSSTSRPRETITLPPRSLDELRNSPITVNEDLMQRLRSFLPAMQQSTQELQQQAEINPSTFDIEHLDSSSHEYIEMNLGLGVYESRPSAPSQDTTSDSDASDDTDSSDASDSDSSTDSESDSGSDSDSGRPDVLSILMSAVPPVPRVDPPPSRPNIVVLQSSNSESPPSAKSS